MVTEKLILEGLEIELNIPSGSLQEKKIMVEVFARIGKLSAAHFEKLANDILKLKLTEDILNVSYKKFIAVCGEDAERYLFRIVLEVVCSTVL